MTDGELFHRARSSHEARVRREELLRALGSRVIGILHGGWSGEREISLKSAECIQGSLSRSGIASFCIEPDGLLDAVAERRMDIVFNVLYGALGEGGAIRGLLALLGVPCTYSNADGSAIALDKWRTKLVASAHGIPTTWSEIINRDDTAAVAAVIHRSEWPVVCKPLTEGCSIGVEFAVTEGELRQIVKAITATHERCLVEPYLSGREFSVAVLQLGNREPLALPILEIRSDGRPLLDMAAKYGQFPLRLDCPAEISRSEADQLARLALRAHRAVGLYPLSRIDFRESSPGFPVLLEVNHHPGMTPHSWFPFIAERAGIPYDDLVLEIVTAALVSEPAPHLARGGPTRDNVAKVSSGRTVAAVVGGDGPLPEYSRVAATHLSEISDEITPVEYTTFLRGLRSHGCGTPFVVDCLYGPGWDGAAPRGPFDALGFRRVGPSLLCCALVADKRLQRRIARSLGMPVPASFDVYNEGTAALGWPRVVKPRYGGQSIGVHVARDEGELDTIVARLAGRAGKMIEVEEWLPGREICVGIVHVHGQSVQVLPILEVLFAGESSINDAGTKGHGWDAAQCPARIDDALARELIAMSLRLHNAFDAPPLARVEWRLDAAGMPRLLEFDHTPGLTRKSYVTRMIQCAGIDLALLIRSLARRPPFRGLNERFGES